MSTDGRGGFAFDSSKESKLMNTDPYDDPCDDDRAVAVLLKPAWEFKTVIFPDCYKHCAAGHYLSVSECESVCEWKFEEQGKPKKEIQ